MRSGQLGVRWALALILLNAGCSGPVAPDQGTGLVGWERERLEHAHFFQLWKKGEDRLLITFGPGGEKDTTGMLFIGNIEKAASPKGSTVLLPHVSRIALSSTTQAPFVSLLGREPAIVGCAHANGLKATSLKERVESGALQELANGDGLDRERLIALVPDVLFSDPFSINASRGIASLPAVCVVAEYLEQEPLGRAEWIKVFGAVLGEHTLADSLYAAIASRYRQAVAEVAPDATRPAVFFGSAWRGVWSVPSGNSYMAKLIQDAGARYLFADRIVEGNLDLDMETVMLQGRPAEWWGRVVDQDRPVTMQDVAGGERRIAGLPALIGHHGFYANSAESDIFGQAVLEPDVQLLDLIGIFHSELKGERQSVYFRAVQ